MPCMIKCSCSSERILDFWSIQKEKKGKREKYSGKKNENGSEIFC